MNNIFLLLINNYSLEILTVVSFLSNFCFQTPFVILGLKLAKTKLYLITEMTHCTSNTSNNRINHESNKRII